MRQLKKGAGKATSVIGLSVRFRVVVTYSMGSVKDEDYKDIFTCSSPHLTQVFQVRWTAMPRKTSTTASQSSLVNLWNFLSKM